MKKLFLFLAAFAATCGLVAQNAKLPENIALKDIDGQSVQSSVIQNGGKPIILSFWATWCKPCNLELDAIKEVYEDWQEETGVKLVAVSIDDARSAARVRPWVNGKDWPYEVFLDQNKDLAPSTSAPTCLTLLSSTDRGKSSGNTKDIKPVVKRS